MNFVAKLLSLARKFIDSRDAIAAVEFALVVPSMLVLYMGTIEISQVITVDRKMSAMAGSLGDLVAQSNEQIETGDLMDYFQAVGLIMAPYSTDNLKQLITMVYVDNDGNASVDWSVGYNGADEIAANTPYTLPIEITSIAHDSYVVVSETQLQYQPWGGYVIEASFNLYKQFFHFPRFGAAIDLI